MPIDGMAVRSYSDPGETMTTSNKWCCNLTYIKLPEFFRLSGDQTVILSYKRKALGQDKFPWTRQNNS